MQPAMQGEWMFKSSSWTQMGSNISISHLEVLAHSRRNDSAKVIAENIIWRASAKILSGNQSCLYLSIEIFCNPEMTKKRFQREKLLLQNSSRTG